MKEINVIGTMQLLAACQKAPSVRRLVVKSSAAVYGSTPRDPAIFTEDTGAKVLPRGGCAKDSVEVEGYVRGFSRRRPDVDVMMLRFANIIGPGIRHRADRLLRAAGRPDRDRVRRRGCSSCTRTTPSRRCVSPPSGSTTGTFNVAGDGVLLALPGGRRLGRAARAARPARARRRPPERSCAAPGSPTSRREQMRFLSYGRGVDTTRMRRGARLRAALHHPGSLRGLRPGPAPERPLSADRVQAAEHAVLEALERVAGRSPLASRPRRRARRPARTALPASPAGQGGARDQYQRTSPRGRADRPRRRRGHRRRPR